MMCCATLSRSKPVQQGEVDYADRRYGLSDAFPAMVL